MSGSKMVDAVPPETEVGLPTCSPGLQRPLLFTSFQVGDALLKKSRALRLVFPHMRKNFGAIFTGGASNSRYSLTILRMTMKYGLLDEDPKGLMVR